MGTAEGIPHPPAHFAILSNQIYTCFNNATHIVLSTISLVILKHKSNRFDTYFLIYSSPANQLLENTDFIWLKLCTKMQSIVSFLSIKFSKAYLCQSCCPITEESSCSYLLVWVKHDDSTCTLLADDIWIHSMC